MLSVRNLLAESQQQQQQQQQQQSNNNVNNTTLNEQLYQKKPSVLNISSLLCSNNNSEPIQLPPLNQSQEYHPSQHYSPPLKSIEKRDSYEEMLWAKQDRLSQSFQRYTNETTFQQQQEQQSMPHYLLNNYQRRSSRQHQIESKKIEQELLYDRRKSSSSSSLSNKYQGDDNYEEEEEEEEIPLKAKRRRASSKQLDILNKVFERTFFPSTQLRAELGRQLGMSPRTVQIWFQNRRQAIRTKERTDSLTSSSSSRENSISFE